MSEAEGVRGCCTYGDIPWNGSNRIDLRYTETWVKKAKPSPSRHFDKYIHIIILLILAHLSSVVVWSNRGVAIPPARPWVPSHQTAAAAARWISNTIVTILGSRPKANRLLSTIDLLFYQWSISLNITYIKSINVLMKCLVMTDDARWLGITTACYLLSGDILPQSRGKTLIFTAVAQKTGVQVDGENFKRHLTLSSHRLFCKIKACIFFLLCMFFAVLPWPNHSCIASGSVMCGEP